MRYTATVALIVVSLAQPSLLPADRTPQVELNPRTMTFDPVEFHPPKAERIVLHNGMVLFLLEDHELPLLRIEGMVRTGSMYEPMDKVALASLTGTVMRTGGTRMMSGDQIDEELEFLAASIDSSIGLDAGYISLNVLAKDFDRGLELFSEVLRHPAFEEEKLDLAKKQTIEGIRRKNDTPGSVASREFSKLLYGEDHPYAREATIKTVSSITRQDLVKFHQRFYHPNSVILGITGDFKTKQMVRKIKRAFESWKRSEVGFPDVARVAVRYEPSVNLIEKKLSQTHLRIGHLGIRRDNPDFFALSIMDDILGGRAFTSRLFREVRTRKGLAYSVGTAFSPRDFDVGVFLAYAQTRAEGTHETISTILEEIKKIQTQPVSEQELREAKEAFLNSFVFSFSSTAQIVNRQVSLEYYGLPEDYLERFRDRVARVSQEDILRVAKKYLHPEGLTVLVVGEQERFDRPLSALGKVRTIRLEEEIVDRGPERQNTDEEPASRVF